MAQLSQEERDFVLEKHFEGKATQQFKQHFGKDLITLQKDSFTKRWKIPFTLNQPEQKQRKFWKTKDCWF